MIAVKNATGKGQDKEMRKMKKEERIRLRAAASGIIATALIERTMAGPPVEFMAVNPPNTGIAG